MANFRILLTTASLLAAWVLPAAAAELPIPPASKPEPAQAPKIISHHPMRVAGAGWQAGCVCAREGLRFPIVIGVAY